MTRNIHISLNKLIVMGLGIILLVALGYRFSKQNPAPLFAFWVYEHETCNLTIANLTERVSFQHEYPGTCNYFFEEIDGSPELIRFDQIKGTIELLRVARGDIVVSEQIQIPFNLTDFPQFSIDGTQLYFSAIMDDIERLYVMDVKTDQIKLLIPDSPGMLTQPKLSPNKRFLTYIQLNSLQNRYECLPLPQTAYTEFVNPACFSNGELYLLDLQTDETVNLTSLVAEGLHSACRPHWSPSSQFLIISGSCEEQGGVALIDVTNNYQVAFFPESLSSGGWLSEDYFLFSKNDEDLTDIKTVAYSIRDQTSTTLPKNILPPLSKYLSTSSSGCLVVDLEEEAILAIYCLQGDTLNFTSNQVAASGTFYYAKWFSQDLFATYHNVLSSEGNWVNFIEVYDAKGHKLNEYEVPKIPLNYPLEPNFGWLSSK